MDFINTILLSSLLLTNTNDKNYQDNSSDSTKIEWTESLKKVDISSQVLKLEFLESSRDVFILEAEDFENLAIYSPTDLLKYISNVEIVERGPNAAQADIKLNGGTFEQSLILIDGHKIMDAQTGHHLLNLPIALEQIERVEILRGSAARIYGINSLAGAINFVTKSNNSKEVQVHLAGGSNFQKNEKENLYANLHANIAAYFNQNDYLQNIALSYDRGNGYRRNTQYEQVKGFYKIQKQWTNKWQFEGFVSAIYNDFGANQFYAPPNDENAIETVITSIAGVDIKKEISSKWSTSLKLSYRFNKDDYRFDKENPSFYQNIHDNHLMQAKWMHFHPTKFLDIRWGMDWNWNSIKSSNLGDWKRQNAGIYLDLFPKWNFSLDVNAGIYANYNQDWGLQLLPGIDISYPLWNTINIFAAWSTGQRIPTYTDLYYLGPNNIGNENLKPETSNQWELGIKGKKNNLQGNISLFYRNVSDLIDWVKENPDDPWRPENFGKVHTQGLNINAKWFLNNLINNSFHIGILPSYTYLFNNTSHFENWISNYQLEYVKQKFVLLTQFRYKNSWSFSPSYRIEQRVSNSLYQIVDLKLSYNNKNMEIYANLNNLTNVQNVDAYSIPFVGFWFNLGAKLVIR